MSDSSEHKSSEFLYGLPKEEIDEPLPKSGMNMELDSLEIQKLKVSEKDKDRKEKRYFTAFKLIVGCLCMLGAIYIVDTIISIVIAKQLSALTEGIVEIIKTLLFTLSGYLFARKENGD